MVKKQTPESDRTPPIADAVKESAQQIWLAGLGAFAKAQEEGGKVFENLVKEGMGIQQKTQVAAQERLAEAASKITHMATDVGARAGQQWGKIENIFQERVSKALDQLDVPTAGDIDELTDRLDALARTVEELKARLDAASHIPASSPTEPATKTPARRPAQKRAAD
ncbi:MAG: phasin family protein [Pseudomonadota bacterium]